MLGWLIGLGVVAFLVLNARLNGLERQMADQTQAILDGIAADKAQVQQVKQAVHDEVQSLKDQLASQQGDTINKQAVLDALSDLGTTITGIDPNANQGSGGGTPPSP